jgi:hypothetical protein
MPVVSRICRLRLKSIPLPLTVWTAIIRYLGGNDHAMADGFRAKNC